jgi:hypothetical protein
MWCSEDDRCYPMLEIEGYNNTGALLRQRRMAGMTHSTSNRLPASCHLRLPLFTDGLLVAIICAITWSANANASSRNTAASQPAASLPDVTVTAPRPPDPGEFAGDAVPNFITSHATPSRVIHQLERWRNGICPITDGLSPAFNSFVTARVEAVAVAVGAPHQAADQCKYNVEVLFTTEPQKILDEVVKRNSALLGFHYSQQEKALATFSRPIQGWYVTSTRGCTGGEAMDETAPLPELSGGMGGIPMGHVPAGCLGSRLVTGQSSAIINAFIVVDTKKVTGMSIGSISDYLAMLILSQSQSPDNCGALPSIIDLMASSCDARQKPTKITAGDLAFLRGLYSTDLEQPLSLETSDVQNKMMREFAAR